MTIKKLSSNRTFQQNLPFILFVLALFIALIVRLSVMPGRQDDGLTYSSIAFNMAHGIGSLWAPRFSSAYFPAFYEHPSLGIYLQSLFIRAFGNSPWLDTLYYFSLTLLNLFSVLLLWRRTNPKEKASFYWIPVLAWLIIPINVMDYNRGYLECTLAILTNLAVYFLLVGLEEPKHKISLSALAGLLIAAAFYVNGMQAFFPLCVPMVYWLIIRRISFWRACVHSILLVLWALFLIGAVLLYEPAYNNIAEYFRTQLLPSLTGMRGDRHGFAHLVGLRDIVFSQFINLFALAGLMVWLNRKYQQSLVNSWGNLRKQKWAIFFFLVALAGSLPVLMSSRQAPRFLLQAMPFYALGFSTLFKSLLEIHLARINTKSGSYQILKRSAILILIASSVLTITSIHSFHRYKAGLAGHLLLEDVRDIARLVPPGSAIGVSEEFVNPGSSNLFTYFIGYFYRYDQITLLAKTTSTVFYLQNKALKNCPSGYKLIPMTLNFFLLCQRQEVVSK